MREAAVELWSYLAVVNRGIREEIQFRGLDVAVLDRLDKLARRYSSAIVVLKLSLVMLLIGSYYLFLAPSSSYLSTSSVMPGVPLLSFVVSLALVLLLYSLLGLVLLRQARTAYRIIHALNSLDLRGGNIGSSTHMIRYLQASDQARTVRKCRNRLKRAAWVIAGEVAVLGGGYRQARDQECWSRLGRIILWTGVEPWCPWRRKIMMKACLVYCDLMLDGQVLLPSNLSVPKKAPQLQRPRGAHLGQTALDIVGDRAFWIGVAVTVVGAAANKLVDIL